MGCCAYDDDDDDDLLFKAFYIVRLTKLTTSIKCV
jgi:hypothetical protein